MKNTHQSKQEKVVMYISMTKDGHYALENLLRAGKSINTIITLPPDKSENISDYTDFSPLAEKFGVHIRHVSNINKEVEYIRSIHPSLIIVNGWSQLLSKEILSIPKYGCVGTHPALLPKNRGRAPIAWHFLNEEKLGGVTIFYLSEGCDDGPIIDQDKFIITKSDNALSFYNKITGIGSQLLLKNYDKIASGTARSRKQNNKRATYLLRRRPQDSFLDFSEAARQVHNKIRAVSGVYPSAFFYYQENEYRVKGSELRKMPKYSGVPGQIAQVTVDAVSVITKDGIITLLEIEDKAGNHVNNLDIFRIGYVINE